MVQDHKTKMQIAKPVSQDIKIGNTRIAVLYTDNTDTWCVFEITEKIEIFELLEVLKAFAAERKKTIKAIYYEDERFDIKVEDIPTPLNYPR